MKNKIISLFISLIFIFTSLISVNAIATAPRVDLDDYQIVTTDKNNVYVSGTVTVARGQNIAVYDSTGKYPLLSQTVGNSGKAESFKIKIDPLYLPNTTNTFKVKSMALKGTLNSSNPKTFTVTIKDITKKDQIITASDLTLKVGETKNLNAKVNSNLSLSYLSSNPSVVTVDSTGKVIGRAKGTAKITINQAGNNEYKAASKIVTITVKDDGGSIPTPAPALKKYTIKYNANYGTGTMSNQSVTGNRINTLSANKFKRPYYTFKGWSTTKNGKILYKNKSKIVPTKNMTLYAVWSAEYKKPNGKVAEGQSPSAGIAFGNMRYSKGSHSRGIICVIRAKDPGLAAAVADNATKIAKNNKIGYSTSSGVGPKLYNSLVKKGPTKAKGKASCCPFALCCLKYSMYTNPEYKFATASKYGIDCNWRSDSRTNIRSGMKSVKKKIEKSGKSCPYIMIYDTSKFKNWKSQLRRGDIAICAHHVFVVL